jgi:AcrR family transcriptional regulator
MVKQKSSKREYDVTGRQAKADETRRRILEAARKQFMERGYSGATAKSIAAEAGVAAPTIYAIFKNKKKLLVSLMNVSPATGVEDHIPMLERTSVQAVSEEHDQRHQLQMLARVVAANLNQVAAISETMKDAAKVELDFDRILQKLNKQRLEHMSFAVQQIAANGPFRKKVNDDYALNTVWTLTSPEAFLLLTRDRGWSKEEYAEWLADLLIRALLP